MSVIVQKYGGSSVGTEERVRKVAQRVAESHGKGDQVVVVVSAMGKTTHALLEQAKTLAENPSRRELDVLLSSGERISASLLAMALSDAGVPSVSLSGPQAGIRTCDTHFAAQIQEVCPDRVHSELRAGKVVVVAGYQGEDPRGDVTTLGRGGSDITAVALAAALRADRCEIYSDVDGIFTADPRVVPAARPIARLGHEEMLALAHCGAKVLNARAVEYAWRHGVKVWARCTFDRKPGTLICAPHAHGSQDAAGVAGHAGILWVRARRPAMVEAIQASLDDVFLEQPAPRDQVDLLAPTATMADPAGQIRALRERFGDQVELTEGLGSVSLVGPGLSRTAVPAEIAARTFDTKGIAARAAWRTPNALTWLVDAAQVTPALQALHGAFLEDQAGAEGAA